MRPPLAVLVFLVSILAGCSGGGDGGAGPVDIPVGAGRAVLSGVVVDESIRPVAGAVVDVTDSGLEATTDEAGEFLLPVPVGSHLLEVRHASFAPIQETVSVPETGLRGLTLRLSLSASEAPYEALLKYDGFVVCSLGISLIFSEECGEGVGTPAGRVGKQGNNAIRYDFQSESPSLKTIVVEQVWEPTSDAGREMLVIVATNWTCEPACGGDPVGAGNVQGPSPLLLRVDEADLAPHLQDPATVFTTYTLARNDVSQVNVLLNQGFQLFVTLFYREGAPEGYSFVADG
ncbi:MAG TPA: carboxypeptidase-like regulatory domain-containing protein [Candidatus Thermoplasmatota archaeon]|nr:carboxypeptidase-like regulatory domain-containing protein [Candidatus Thermoplasmatota archaeon]